MKTILKSLIYTLIFTCFCIAANAQSYSDTLRVSIGITGALANGDYGTPVYTTNGTEDNAAYSYGAGIALQVDIPVIEHINLTASAGYNNFFTTQYATNSQAIVSGYTLPNFQTIPLKLGIKWFLGKAFYVQGEAGETLLANKTQLYAVYSNAFTYAPQAGFLFRLKRHSYVDAGFRFESASSFYNNGNKPNVFWGLHLAYAVNL